MAQRTLFLLLIGFVGTVCIIMVSFNKMATSEENGGTIYVCVCARQCLRLNFLLFLLRILLVVRLIVQMQPHP